MSVVYVFLDGVGLGKNDPDRNPYARYAHSYLSAAGGHSGATGPGDWHIVETDASLGFAGLPQSATGQTALWTGVNGARVMGRHMTGFPGPTLIRVIQEFSMIKRAVEAGKRSALLNAYTDSYIDRITERPRLASASTHVQRASGQALKNMDDLDAGDAIYMDITHEVLHHIYPEMRERFPVRSARERGVELAAMAARYDLVLYEFFLTDKCGHDQDWEMARWCIETLEQFLDGLRSALDPDRDLLLVTSDHGNSEDLSVKTHTNNAVPTFAFGRNAARAAAEIHSLIDIPGFIYRALEMPDEPPEELHQRASSAGASL